MIVTFSNGKELPPKAEQLAFLQDGKQITEHRNACLGWKREPNGLCSIFYVPIKRKCILKDIKGGRANSCSKREFTSLSIRWTVSRASDLIHFKLCMYTHMRGRKRLESSRQMLM